MLRHCVSILFVPFYTVRFPDFFLGDQVGGTSRVETSSLHIHKLFTICFMWSSAFAPSPLMNTMTFTCSSPRERLPSFGWSLSFCQISFDWFKTCADIAIPSRRGPNLWRRLMYPNIYNGIKYLLSIISCSLFQYPKLFVIAQTIYTLYALYWDIREDWGTLLEGEWTIGLLTNSNVHSKWFMLREKTLIPYPFIYHLFIFADILLRFAWVARIRTVGASPFIYNSKSGWMKILVISSSEHLRSSDEECGISFVWRTNKWITAVSSGNPSEGAWWIEQILMFQFHFPIYNIRVSILFPKHISSIGLSRIIRVHQ